MEGVEYWCYPTAAERAGRVADVERWNAYFSKYEPTYKPSTGLRAIFCAVEFLDPPEIGLIGFDRLYGSTDTHKWYHGAEGELLRPWLHDSAAERRAAEDLVTLIDLRTYANLLRV